MLLSVKFRLDSWLRCTATNGRLVQRSLWNKDSEPEKELPDDADHVDRITFETAADQKQIMQISRMYENNNEKSKQTFLGTI